jgi:nicotinamide-nucleotide amidase
MAMATGVRQLAGSDFGLAVTGIAGPDGGTPEKPVGTVWIALADNQGCQARLHCFTGDREQIRSLTANAALEWLQRTVQHHLSD